MLSRMRIVSVLLFSLVAYCTLANPTDIHRSAEGCQGKGNAARPPAKPPRPNVAPPKPTASSRPLPTTKVGTPKPVTPKKSMGATIKSAFKSMFQKGPSFASKKAPPTTNAVIKPTSSSVGGQNISSKYPNGKDAIFQAIPDFSELQRVNGSVTSKYSDPGGKDAIFAKLPDFSNGPPPSIANSRGRIFQKLPSNSLAISNPLSDNLGTTRPNPSAPPVPAYRGASPSGPPNPRMGLLPPRPVAGSSPSIVYGQLPPTPVNYSQLPSLPGPRRDIRVEGVRAALTAVVNAPDNPANNPRP